MDVEAFKTQWRRWYGHAPPIGHLLREFHSDVWLRIHSLPGSKRYAETPADWTELLSRQNAVATALLGDGSQCILVTPRYSSTDEPMPELLTESGVSEDEAVMELAPRLLGQMDESWPGAEATRESYDGDCRVWLYAAPLTWSRGALDALVRAVADDETRFLLVACDSGRVYAPYDGGADLFFRTPEEWSFAHKRYRHWLSPLPHGM
jgi:hypothetical protein